VESIKFSKRRAREKREDRKKLEEKYVELLRSNTLADMTEVKAALQKHYEEEDDIIRFRANINEAEFDEKYHHSFFGRS
jgi:hypothetical protein